MKVALTGLVDFETKRETKSPVSSRWSQTRVPEEWRMGGKLEGQNLQETAFAKDRNGQLSVPDETSGSALHFTKRALAHYMITGHLFLISTRWRRGVWLGV